MKQPLLYQKNIIYSKQSDINFNNNNINKLNKYKYFNTNIKNDKGKNTITVKNYIRNNLLNSFILLTLLNECCRYILLYHNILNCYHGDTNVDKFILNINNNCIRIPYHFVGNDTNVLTHDTKINDFKIFFNSFYDELSYKNKHFIKHFLYFNETYIKNLS